MDLRLRNRTVIVTGGSAGIGRGTVELLVREGANVVTCARGQEALDATVRAVDPEGERTLALPMDMTEPEAAENLYHQALERFGRVDGLVNNVGTAVTGPFLEITDEQWVGDLDLKLYPAIRLIRAAIPEMRERGSGSIVNVLSIVAKQPPAGSMPTSVTRAAGLALTKALSKEFAADGIRVNAVLVGFIKSGQQDQRWQREAPELAREDWYLRVSEQRGVPMGRAGTPEEVASVIGLLLSEAAGYTSGVAINIDGAQAAVH
jgi:3-oxoacyl-[acyl-carrier protein] reductase